MTLCIFSPNCGFHVVNSLHWQQITHSCSDHGKWGRNPVSADETIAAECGTLYGMGCVENKGSSVRQCLGGGTAV